MADEQGLPPEIWRALDAIAEGATADEVESAQLDFKRDPATSSQAKNPDAKLVEMLVHGAICFANGEVGQGYIVLGVADRIPGAGAFIGTAADPEWIRRKIFDNTNPGLHTLVRAINYLDSRLVIIQILPALALHTTTKGQGWYRVGKDCLPLTEEVRRSIAAQRANPDLSNRPTELTADDLELAYLNEARRLLQVRRRLTGETVPETTSGLMRELGLTRVVAGNEVLITAAQILLLPPPPGRVTVRHLWRRIPGGDPEVTEIAEPVITALPGLRRLISDHGSQEVARVSFSNGQESAIPAFPGVVVDEIISNAFVHRDWNMVAPIVVEQSPRLLKVISPGALPYGVHEDNILSTHSIPRNPALMAAMRILGLVEESSRGFDRMWKAMLETGRDAPSVAAADDVTVTVMAGSPNLDFIVGLRNLGEAFGEDNVTTVNSLIILWYLNDHPLISLSKAAYLLQVSDVEAKETLTWLTAEVQLLTQLPEAAEWALSKRARVLLKNESPAETPEMSVQQLLESRLQAGEAIAAREFAEELGLDRKDVTRMLRGLRSLGRARIDPRGPQRGPSVTWIAG